MPHSKPLYDASISLYAVSFVVPSDIVPGRMVLCVTTILTLTSMFNSVRERDALHI